MRKTIVLFSLLGFIAHFHCLSQDLLYLSGSGASPNLTVQAGVDVYVEGGYVANAGASGMKLDGNLYIGKTTGSLAADWTDNMASSSVIASSTGTVYLQ